MLPTIDGLPTRPFVWVLAAILGAALAVANTSRDGVGWRKSLLIALGGSVAIFLGSKLLYLTEQHMRGAGTIPSVIDNLEHGFRLPGGILLLDVVLPTLCLVAGVSWLSFADRAAPAVGAAIVVIRLGCFLNGCCFGAVSNGWFALRFPPGSLAFESQLDQNLITLFDTWSLPVHPLQLYFASLGLVLFLVTSWLQPRRFFEGQVWLVFNVVFFAGTFLLEFVRTRPFELNLLVCSIALLGCAWVSFRRYSRSARLRLAAPSSEIAKRA